LRVRLILTRKNHTLKFARPAGEKGIPRRKMMRIGGWEEKIERWKSQKPTSQGKKKKRRGNRGSAGENVLGKRLYPLH